jgi:hypothetical protein
VKVVVREVQREILLQEAEKKKKGWFGGGGWFGSK